MADKNKKGVDSYEDSPLCEARVALAAAEGLISRVAWCLGFGGPLSETRPMVEAWCAEREAEKLEGKRGTA